MPFFSFIVPVWNRAHSIAFCIKSVLNQDASDFEIIVFDDGSTDDSLKVVKTLMDPRIRIFRSEKNLGVNAARNRAVHESKGEWLVMLDSDDQLMPNSLKLLKKELASLTPDTALAFYGTLEKKSSCMKSYFKENSGYISYKDYLGENVLRGEFLPVVRRKAFLKIKGYNEELIAFERYTWLQLARRFRVWANNRPTRLYGHEDDHRLTKLYLTPERMNQRISSYEAFLAEFGKELQSFYPKKQQYYQIILALHYIIRGQPSKARLLLKQARRLGFSLRLILLYLLSYFGRWPLLLSLRWLRRSV